MQRLNLFVDGPELHRRRNALIALGARPGNAKPIEGAKTFRHPRRSFTADQEEYATLRVILKILGRRQWSPKRTKPRGFREADKRLERQLGRNLPIGLARMFSMKPQDKLFNCSCELSGD